MSGPPVDSALHRRIVASPGLAEPHFAAMRQFGGANLPEQTSTSVYFADVAWFFATVLVAAFDFDLRAKPKRRSNVAGFHGDMCAIGFAQTILHLEHFTGNDELLTGANGRHLIGLIAGHRPEMAEPVRLHLAGGERLEQGRSVAKLLLQTCERNGYKTKSDSMGMVMAIPTSLRICREGMADHFGVAFEELVEPLRR